MKPIITLLCLISMLALLCACGSDTTPNVAESELGTESAVNTDADVSVDGDKDPVTADGDDDEKKTEINGETSGEDTKDTTPETLGDWTKNY